MITEDDSYRQLVRRGLAPMLDHVEGGPEYDTLMVEKPVAATARPYPVRWWRVTLAFSAMAALLVGMSVLVRPEAPAPEADSQEQTEPTASVVSTTGAGPTIQPSVTDLQISESLPFRVLAVRPNVPSFAVLDFDMRTVTLYGPGAHSLPGSAVDGAVMTPGGDWIIWSHATARLFSEGLDRPGRILGSESRDEIEGIAAALRVAPTRDGRRVWLVQLGLTMGSVHYPTLIELVELSSGRGLETYEVANPAVPVGATRTGLILNLGPLVETSDGWVADPTAQRVVHLGEDGSVVEIGEGRAIAVGPEIVISVRCPAEEPTCDLYRVNELVLSKPDGSSPLVVTKPFSGTWSSIGGPSVPTGATAMQAVSPTGSQLLVSIARDLDVNGVPASSALLSIDLSTGIVHTLLEFDGPTPVATWSSDGMWIAVFAGSDVELINALTPDRRLSAVGAIPAAHFPLAAG